MKITLPLIKITLPLLAAGLLLTVLSTGANAHGRYPHDLKTLPPAAAAPTPQTPTYWTSYFDTMYDEEIDVTAAANARTAGELSRSGWNRMHQAEKPKH